MSSVFSVRPTTWELNHVGALASGAHYTESHDGQLPNNAFWRDLEFRFHRNESAFGINHPNFRLFLDSVFSHPAPAIPCLPPHRGWVGHMRGSCICPPPICNPISPPNGAPTWPCQYVPPQLATQVVPEPAASTMLVAALVFVAGWAFLTKGKR